MMIDNVPGLNVRVIGVSDSLLHVHLEGSAWSGFDVCLTDYTSTSIEELSVSSVMIDKAEIMADKFNSCFTSAIGEDRSFE